MKTLRFLVLIGVFIISNLSIAQTNNNDQANQKQNDSIKNWKAKMFFNLGINGSILYNWTAGGDSNLTIQAISKMNLDYKKDKVSFTNELDLIYGLTTDHGELLSKDTDLIQLENEFNYQLNDKFHLSLLTHLTTQFSPGYIYTETDTDAEIKTQISSFLSPGLSNQALGINMIGKSYELAFAPLAMKQTTVINSDLDASIYGVTSGKVRNETGLYLNANGNFKFLNDKLSLDTDLIAFTPYNNIGTLDIIFKYLLEYKISKVFSVNSSMFIIYDDDIGRPELIDTDGNGIPDEVGQASSRVQLKQVLSIGISFMI